MASFLSRIANSVIQGAIAAWGLELRPDGAASVSERFQIMATRGAPTDAPSSGVGFALNVEASGMNDLLYGYAGSWVAAELDATAAGFVDGSNWFTTDTMQGLADAVVAAIGGTSQGIRNFATNYVLADNASIFTALSSLDAAFGDTLANLTTTSKVLVGAINEVDADATQALADAAALEAQVGVTVLANLTTTDKTGLQPAINEVDANADAAQAQANAASEQIWPMSVLGAWAFDGDGARTNGGGLVGATPTLTEAAPGQCVVENGGVFGNLAAVNAGYAATYQMFPDVPVAETDFCYFGASIEFCEIALDMGTVATYDAAGVLTWQYWNGAAWSTLTIAHDGTSASTDGGTLAFGRDGAITFHPPADWAQNTVNGGTLFWIRAGIAAGKAANLTQIPITNSKQHEVVSPAGGFVARQTGTITDIRIVDGAATLHTTADVKFFVMNYTTGETSGILTFAQDIRAQVFTGLTLAVTADDVLGAVVTQEDGAAEPSGVILELGVTIT